MNHDAMSHLKIPTIDRPPRLLSPSLYALDLLYSNDRSSLPPQIHHPLLLNDNVHEFLLWLQSRNVRRQAQSLHQHFCDAPKDRILPDAALEKVVYMGSSWLACIAILCHLKPQPAASGYFVYTITQRMFAVQTILHRCRRVKLVEALDWELEDWIDTANPQELVQQYLRLNGSSPASITSLYLHCIHQVDPVMAIVLTEILGSSSTLHTSSAEEQTKSEYSLFTLAILSVQISLESLTLREDIGRITPLLSLTASTLATVIFRWWYSCYSSSLDNDPTSVPSMVSLIRQTFARIQTPLERQYGGYAVTVAVTMALLCTIAALPDAVLASPGGARGRLSIDPRAIQLAAVDLRRSTEQLHAVLMVENNCGNDSFRVMIHRWLLYTCEHWVTYIPLNDAILSLVHPLMDVHTTGGLTFLIAIYESASWTIDQIISSFVGLSSSFDQNPQPTAKKKQSNRSKKRHKELVDSKSTDKLLEEANAEMKFRGDLAYHITLLCWSSLSVVAESALDSHQAPVEGEGPVGCITACANACLPHILRYPDIIHGCELFQLVSNVMQRICASSNKTVRALALEPLYTIHTELLVVNSDVTKVSLENGSIGLVVVNHFYNCAMNLASRCEYPAHYFDHLCQESDQDLEMERNDVRDLLRTIAGSPESTSFVNDTTAADEPTNDISTHILKKLVNACKDAVILSRQQNNYIPETVVHAFSSLAKPVNHISKHFTQSDKSNDDRSRSILITVLQVLLEINKMVLEAFQHSLHNNQLLPLCRTVNIGNASYAPFLSVLALFRDQEIVDGLNQVLDAMVLGSILSLERIPELYGPSILDHSMYDIRGTMRGPGGEDHVGCLTLMRCSFEDDRLAHLLVRSCIPYISRLCTLHNQLKLLEVSRDPSIVHGQGVTPQTRRILLGSLCQLELKSQGQLGASAMLNGLFISALEGITSMHSRIESLGESELFQITESTLDIVAFTAAIVSTLFDQNSIDSRFSACLQVLTTAAVNGYKSLYADGALRQWKRLLAALFALMKKSAQSTGDISERGCAIIVAVVVAECEAIHRQCDSGPMSASVIFVDDVLSPDSIPAGVMVRALTEVVMHSSDTKLNTSTNVSLQNTTQALLALKDPVLAIMGHACSDPQCNNEAFVDPRPTLSEAWFQAMIALAECPLIKNVSSNGFDPSAFEMLLVDTCSRMVSLLFYPSLGKTIVERVSDPGMSLDGPHSLAMMAYFSAFFRLGPRILETVGDRLFEIISLNLDVTLSISSNRGFLGTAIIGAALFRACQGALPPWAIESVPEIYSSLFEFALGKDVEAFCLWIRLSMELRSSSHIEQTLIGMRAGQLLSGRNFESMSNQAKLSFLDEVRQVALADGAASWRRLKGLMKQACGGKKKDTDFKQKPSPTRWDFDRL